MSHRPRCCSGVIGLPVARLRLACRADQYPLLRLALFKVRTFRVSVAGGFVTRLGVGGLPFMLPLLYQVGLGMPPGNPA